MHQRRFSDRPIQGLMFFRVLILAGLAVFAALIGACASSPSSELVPVYGTMKLIERGAVAPAEVIARTDRVERLLVDGIRLGELGDLVRREVGYYDLMPSDRYLIDTILGDVAYRLELSYDVPLSPEHVAAITDVLRSIRTAAAMY